MNSSHSIKVTFNLMTIYTQNVCGVHPTPIPGKNMSEHTKKCEVLGGKKKWEKKQSGTADWTMLRDQVVAT